MTDLKSLHSKLSAVSMLAAVAFAVAEAGPTLRTAGIGNNRRPAPPKVDTALQREIAAHNEAVDRRKAEKKARKGVTHA